MADTAATTPDNSQPTTDGLLYSTDFLIKALAIVTSDGVVADIKSAAVEINLYEDIFSPCMSGTILMGDALDLISNLQLHGNEFLVIEIDKPGLDSPIKKVFRIYKISHREFTSASMQNYLLHFCSEELMLSTQKILSKSYKGMVVSDMIKDILTNQLQTDAKKIALLDTTEGIFNVIIPRMQPLEAIDWLATRAYSSEGTLFFFFENRDGYNFVSYETLMKNPVYQVYYKKPKLNIDPMENLNSVNFLQIVQDFDVISSGRYGAYSATLMTYDFVSRKVVSHNTDANKFKTLNDNIPVNDSQSRFKTKLTKVPEYFLKFHPTTAADTTTNGAQPENWLHKKASRLAQIHTFKMIITVPGDPLLKTGMIIGVEIPAAMPQTDKGEINEQRTGKYLVAAVHHIMINGIMTTTMELLSDSVTGILNASSDGAGMQLVKKS